MVPDTQPGACDIYCNRFYYTTWPLHTAFFTNALYNSDQLRQRVFFALQKIDVTSTNVIARPSQFTPYLNILATNAFGNYRDILEQITLNPAMGAYLNMYTSTKTNPNENYAREIMQLFSIGTELLNQDGTTKNDLVAGSPLPSYDQSVIDQLKLVFTGWYIPNVTASLLGDPASHGRLHHADGDPQERLEPRRSSRSDHQDALPRVPAGSERRRFSDGRFRPGRRPDRPRRRDRRALLPPEHRRPTWLAS